MNFHYKTTKQKEIIAIIFLIIHVLPTVLRNIVMNTTAECASEIHGENIVPMTYLTLSIMPELLRKLRSTHNGSQV